MPLYGKSPLEPLLGYPVVESYSLVKQLPLSTGLDWLLRQQPEVCIPQGEYSRLCVMRGLLRQEPEISISQGEYARLCAIHGLLRELHDALQQNLEPETRPALETMLLQGTVLEEIFSLLE